MNQAIVVLDDYHPFEDEKAKPNKFSDDYVGQQQQQQAQIPAYNNQSRQAYGTQAAPQISTAELQVNFIDENFVFCCRLTLQTCSWNYFIKSASTRRIRTKSCRHRKA